jgi:P-type E1-E2 ATPase
MYQNFQSSKMLESLAKALRMPSRCDTLRSGMRAHVPVADLVPGDIVFLSAGETSPADMRILQAQRARVDKSSLTGESDPVAASTDPAADHCDLLSASNIILLGSRLVEGEMTCVVFATGDSCCMADLIRLTAADSGDSTTTTGCNPASRG